MRRATSPKIIVGTNDSMPDVLTRLRAATGSPASLAIPASSSLFLTASEFRALKAAAEQARISLTVETDDRLRKQLATMFQIPVIDLLPSAVTDLQSAPPDVETNEPVEITPKPIAPDLPKLDLPPAVEVAPKWEPRKPSEAGDNADEVEALKTDRRSLHVPWKPIGIGIGALALLALLAVGLAYYLQTATVTLTLKRQQVSADIAYAVVSPGSEAPAGALFTITATPVTMEVPFQETIPVTGVLSEPDQVATGNLALRNPSNKAVTIKAGETFKDRDGVEYTFTNDVTVPAADSTSGPGRAEASVTAATGGEAANRDLGMLSGKLENGVYYSNRDAAVAGGSDKKTAIVDQADIDKLVADANAGILSLAVNTVLSDSRTVLPGSLKPGELTYTTSAKVGDPADSVSIDAKMVVDGMAFLPSDAQGPAQTQVQQQLESAVPAGYQLEEQTITYEAPVLVNNQGDAGLFRLTATANAKPVVEESQLNELKTEIAGKSVDEVSALLAGQPFVTGSQITSSPSFMPVRIPSSTSKIKIVTS